MHSRVETQDWVRVLQQVCKGFRGIKLFVVVCKQSFFHNF